MTVLHGYYAKGKPVKPTIVSINEMKKCRHGKLDASLDKLFGTKTKKVGWTNQTGEWRKQ